MRSEPSPSVLIRVRSALPSLRPAERRVAEAVLADPADVSESSITTVARRCHTSETTVLRFCRAIGLAGYPELRIALARAAQGEESVLRAGVSVSAPISPADPLGAVVAKITHADACAVADTGAAVDLAMLESAVAAASSARRVDIYAMGASALVGHDLHQQLHRIGIVSFMWWDAYLAQTSAEVLQRGDVAIGISHTGSTAATVTALEIARRRGATAVAVTNFDRSPITVGADIVLTTAARETTFRSGVTASRIAQLTLVDCLFAGIAQRFQHEGREVAEIA